MESQPQNPEFRNNPENFHLRLIFSLQCQFHFTSYILQSSLIAMTLDPSSALENYKVIHEEKYIS